ncbi:MAG TPA: MarC family protein [Acidimicrobiia bacterium]
MDRTVNVAFVVETFFLMLIGIGPKIALLPFLDTTAGLDPETTRRVSRKMITTAGTVAFLLLALGELLTRLLHFDPGSLSVAGGIVLLIIAISMVLGTSTNELGSRSTATDDPMALAVYPLAIPYLLNPVGIVALVTQSAESAALGTFAVVVILVAGVLVLDLATFGLASRFSQHLNENRLLVAEKVFGFLLAALAVQLILDGLSSTGVIHLTGH